MQEMIIQVIGDFGYFGIAFLIALENVFPPIPSEIILPFGGFATTFTNLQPVGVVIAATIGSVIGALILYLVGRLLSAERLERWLGGKVGRLLGFKQGDIYKACEWFDKKGKITVLFCRCIPVVRSLISIPAGMAKVTMPAFMVMTIIGTAIWNTLLVYLGVVAGNSWERIADYVGAYSHVVIVIIAVVVIIAAAAFLIIRKRKKKD